MITREEKFGCKLAKIIVLQWSCQKLCSHTNTSPCGPDDERDTQDISPEEPRRERDMQDTPARSLETRNTTRLGGSRQGAAMGCPSQPHRSRASPSLKQ
jgi:hypothetical protein